MSCFIPKVGQILRTDRNSSPGHDKDDGKRVIVRSTGEDPITNIHGVDFVWVRVEYMDGKYPTGYSSVWPSHRLRR